MQKTFPAPLFLKIFLTKDTHLWHVECMECSHEVKVPKHEAEMIPEVQKMSKKLAEGEISEEEFHQVFGQFTFVVDLLNQAHDWQCPTCDEKVDWKFQVCWNCSTPNPDIKSDGQEPEAPEFVPPSCGSNVISQ